MSESIKKESWFEELMITVLNGEATPEEEHELRVWLENAEENRNLFDKMKRVVEASRVRDLDVPYFNEEKGWETVKGLLEKSIKQKRKNVWSIWMWRGVAAAVIILCGVAGGIFMQEKSESEKVPIAQFLPGSAKATLFLDDGSAITIGSRNLSMMKNGAEIKNDSVEGLSFNCVNPGMNMKYNRLVIPKAGEYKLVLPDGSRVWINSESELRFPSCFSEDCREVELKGEAYFEVTHDQHKPFLVKTDDITVKVYGTKFNVSAYSNVNNVEATLIDGSVSVTSKASKEVFIRPDQQFVYSRSDGRHQVRKVDASLFAAWKDGVYAFDNTRLEDIMVYLSRWYAFEVEYEDDSLRDLVFTGEIEKDRSLIFGLELIRLTCEVNFTINGNKIKVIK